MKTSPITDKDIGKIHDNWEHTKFRDVRNKANREYTNRKKSKRNRRPRIPKYKPDDEFVATTGGYGTNKHYYLVKVVDFGEHSVGRGFDYFCILLKTTDPKKLDRIGRLVNVQEDGFMWKMADAKVSPKGIKWITY